MDTVKKHLLFVDDELPILEAFERMLHPQSETWELHFAQDADTALRMAAEHNMDVVVTDVWMSGKDGFDLLRSLRASKQTCNVPTIVVTGDSEPALKRRALDLGATDLLTKPVSPEDLLARIRNALRLKSYQDQIEEQVRTHDCRVKERTLALEESHREVVWRLAKAGEYRDDQTGNHVMRVACYSRAIAEGLEMDKDFTDALFATSALHDVGKIGVSDNILLKRGPLTKEERKTMQEHCQMGAGILTSAPKAINVRCKHGYVGSAAVHTTLKNSLLDMAAVIAKNHHEKWDGSGYPDGLSEKNIPLEARVVALADVFDALTSERPYKPAFSKEKSFEIIREETGRHFDPQVVAAFERNRTEVAAIHAELHEEEAIRSPWEG